MGERIGGLFVFVKDNFTSVTSDDLVKSRKTVMPAKAGIQNILK